MNKYITYGFSKFDKDMIIHNTILDCSLGKPESAWWGSPINAEFGWKDWCKNEEWYPKKSIYDTFEDYLSDYILWTLEEGSKILYINSIDSLKDFIDKKYIIEYETDYYKFDFFKIKEDYDAIQLNDEYLGHYFLKDYFRLELVCSAWDCQSIVVLNPEKIIIIEESGSK